MKIVVCIRRGVDGEIGPFDAAAYEAALRIPGAEVILLSMAPLSDRAYLSHLTRLGAKRAVLLSDAAFRGADTLASAYALSLAIEKLSPDLIFCGRQTLVGDTAQLPIMLCRKLGFSLITGVTRILSVEDRISCLTRKEGEKSTSFPALLTLERIFDLRRPRLGSPKKECEIWSAEDVGADPKKCGLSGSPTRVLATKENSEGKRNGKVVLLSDLPQILRECLEKTAEKRTAPCASEKKLNKVLCIGDGPRIYANRVFQNIMVTAVSTPEEIIRQLRKENPDAVLFGSDDVSKRLAAEVAQDLELGLCADCTALDSDGENLLMIRPALAGSVIATIKSTTRPALATVRLPDPECPEILLGIGYGGKDSIENLRRFAEKLGAGLASSRKMVDGDFLPYQLQVGLTGKTVSPTVYLAVGISGAIHHLVGIRSAGTVIAVNPDPNAPIFEYADYRILATAEELTSNYTLSSL